MNKQEIIDKLVILHASIQQHHACNSCNSNILFKKSGTLLAIIDQLRKEEVDNAHHYAHLHYDNNLR